MSFFGTCKVCGGTTVDGFCEKERCNLIVLANNLADQLTGVPGTDSWKSRLIKQARSFSK
jgi:hypothetical protein